MDVFIYAPWIYQKGGAERVVLDLAKDLNAKKIFTSHFEPKNTFEEFKNFEVVQVGSIPVAKSFASLIIVSLKIMFQKLPVDKNSILVVSTAGFGEFITFRNKTSKTVCFCYTPLRIIHDDVAQRDYFKRRGLLFKLLFQLFKTPYVFFERLAFSRFDLVVADSLNVRKRLLDGSLGKSVVVYPGVGLVKPKPIFKKYFLAAGRFITYKNFELAINSFITFKSKVGSKSKDFKLVLAGSFSEINSNYLSSLKLISSERSDIIFVLNPSEERLKKLYSECFAVLFTAINEDFGLVPVEAMAWGKQVIALNQGGVKETVIDGVTGRLCYDEKDFAEAMLKLKNSRKSFKACIERAGLFSKEEFAKKIQKIVFK
ncbi:MAG: glycosyltransferase [Candidatus Marsarchaeota archaeon]|nr:glycosyltransferase [Candidatus Marsarchaeota archaeon]